MRARARQIKRPWRFNRRGFSQSEAPPTRWDSAVASYGEEARLHLARAASYLTGPGPTLPAERRDDYGREIAAAVILYAEQAARGSVSGVNSLRTIAQQLLQPDPRHCSQTDCLNASIGDA